MAYRTSNKYTESHKLPTIGSVLNQILMKLIYQNSRNSIFFDEGKRSDTTAVD